MKRLGVLFATIVMIILFAMSASALDATGQCGDNVYWNYDSNTGNLILYGAGETRDYDYESDIYSPFSEANITNVVIDDGITVIGEELFIDTSIKNISFPDSLTKIEDRAFTYCSGLTSLKFNDTLESIGEEAFSCCENISGALIIPDSVTHIGRYAFQFCSKFERLYIGKRVGSLGPYTFNACSGIQDIIINPALKRIDVGSFAGVSPKHTYFISYDPVTNCMDPRYRGENLHYNYVFDGEHFCVYTKRNIKQPTCTEKGYTTNICNCGYSYISDYTDEINHVYTSEITIQPTHLTEGIETFTCKCNKTYTKAIEKLAEHFYNKRVTVPTCTEQGYTTYICECGDTYVSDYTDMVSHNYTVSITIPATHLTEGLKTFTCSSCGDSYTESIAKIPQHSYTTSKVTKATCTEQGYVTYFCDCGDSYTDSFSPKKGHTYNGQTCIDCGDDCSCNCHKGGIMGFFWKIINFFNKLFKSKQYCGCGAKHW